MEQFGHGKGTIYGGCSEYTIVPSKYAYLLKSDIDDAKAAILERKIAWCMYHGNVIMQSSKCMNAFCFSTWCGPPGSGGD